MIVTWGNVMEVLRGKKAQRELKNYLANSREKNKYLYSEEELDKRFGKLEKQPKVKVFFNGCARAVEEKAHKAHKAVKNFANKDGKHFGQFFAGFGIAPASIFAGFMLSGGPESAEALHAGIAVAGVVAGATIDGAIGVLRDKRTMLQRALTPKRTYKETKKSIKNFVDGIVEKGR